MSQGRADNSELYGIQILRAVAALAVVAHHILEHSNAALGRFSPDWLTTSGAAGVDIFFVISGFIMFHVSFGGGRTPPKPGDFLFRRATRIYPFYWVCCLAILLIKAMGFLNSHHYGASAIISSFLLTPGDKLIVVSWTLVFEIYFYLLFAATLWLRSAQASLIGTSAAIFILYLASPLIPAGDWAELFSNPIAIEFCLGLGLAYIFSKYMQHGQDWPVPTTVAMFGFALLIAAPLFVAHPDTNGLQGFSRFVAWGIPSVLVVAGFLRSAPPKTALKRFMVLLGNASYALYLTHIFVMIGYGRILKIGAISRMHQLPLTLVFVTIAVAVGLAAHLLVEKPMLALIRRLSHREPGHAVPV